MMQFKFGYNSWHGYYVTANRTKEIVLLKLLLCNCQICQYISPNQHQHFILYGMSLRYSYTVYTRALLEMMCYYNIIAKALVASFLMIVYQQTSVCVWTIQHCSKIIIITSTSWCISLSKNQALVCVITLSKTTTGIIVQWKLIV